MVKRFVKHGTQRKDFRNAKLVYVSKHETLLIELHNGLCGIHGILEEFVNVSNSNLLYANDKIPNFMSCQHIHIVSRKA